MEGQWKEEDDCVFCGIVRGDDSQNSRVVYRDDLVVVFHDILPKAHVHLLVIPVRHIRDIKTLRYEENRHHILEHMLKVGRQCLREEVDRKPLHAGETQQYEPKFGFHVPPFTSVDHLHLHCLAPPFIKRNPLFSALKSFHLKYAESAPWYMPAEELLRRFAEAMAPED